MSLARSGFVTVMAGLCLLGVLSGCGQAGQPTAGTGQGRKPARLKTDYPAEPVPFTQVEFTDDFWASRIETNRKVSIPYAFGKCEENGRMENFEIAAGLKTGRHRGSYPFDDTDPYKILEGASYSLSVHPDAELDEYLDDLIAKIAAAQEDDGYLYTCRTNKSERLRGWFGDERWAKLENSHELYNMGHLYEAAVAHYQATGKRTLLDVAVRNADLLCTVFGPGKLEKAPGHQVIEMGLAKLYRATGRRKYLDLAKFYLDVRGPGGSAYNQSHLKPVDQTEAVGHAVRASYMYCGMADVAALAGDARYAEAAGAIWRNVVGRKLYLTGGIGATGAGEAFGKDYELPNETAYCETCAAIGNVMWNHRMFLYHRDARFIDVLERTLYNALISGVSLEGDRFFYPNPLASHGQHKRSAWFGCACCPGNITRFIASVPGYVYATEGSRLYVNLFGQNSATVRVAGRDVRITQQSRYPWDGHVKLTVEPEKPGRFTICLRVPGWAQGRPVPSDLYRYAAASGQRASLKVNGKSTAPQVVKGYAVLAGNWKKGATIELDLPMPVRRVLAHEKVEADAGRVALERGPIVYCAEWVDNPAGVHNLVLDDTAELTAEYRGDLLGGVTVVHGKAVALEAGAGGAVMKKRVDLTAIPYYAWAHRGQGDMAVWLARDEAVAQPASPPGTIRNGSFERAAGSKPAGWRQVTYGGSGKFGYVDGGRTGKKCVMLWSDTGADIGWLATVPVKPRSRYRLTGWIRTENVSSTGQRPGKGALLNLHNIQPVQTNAVTGTKDWTKVEVQFDTGARAAIEINCLFGGWGLSTGRAWYDDIELELLSSKAGQGSLEIDAAKTAEPVSKYIYGQFIEHLGRCIYGGIWAEMLEDRKFWYPITADYAPYKGARPAAGTYPVVAASPWQIIGPAESVKMVKADSFVGEHTPLIAAGAGIAQHDLGVQKGKDYVGYVWLKPAGDASTVRVSLSWGDGPGQRRSQTIACTSREYRKFPLRFGAGADTESASLSIEVVGGGACFVGTASLMPADNVKGMRRDTLELLKELNAPIYRWPGGNFASGYDWRDGVGPRDRRPPRKNPAWTGVEHNDFGLHEYLAFCEEVGAEPLITVNSGFGDAHSAAEEVEYVVGSPDTPMGKWRAANGHPEPWHARWWCIGNEMYGRWQLGHMSLDHYTIKHNLFARAMRKVYPGIKLVGVGAVGSWSEGMLKSCADYMDAISEHFYKGAKESVVEHVGQISEAVRQKVEAHKRYREQIAALAGKDIDIALDEWNFWYGPHVFGELGTRYFHKDALGIAAGLHEMIRNSEWFVMANYAQTVNVIGCIKTSKTAAAFATTALPLKLYREHFGTIPVELGGDAFPLDVAAAWTADKKALTIGIVNPTERRQRLPLRLKGARLSGEGTLWLIAHDDPMAYNEPGKAPEVVIESRSIRDIGDELALPRYSISLYRLGVK